MSDRFLLYIRLTAMALSIKIHQRIVASAYYLYKYLSILRIKSRCKAAGRIRILMYHDIPPGSQCRFEEQLRWLMKAWTIITPERFEDMILGREPILGQNLLLTFDDGFASNRVVVEKVLNPLGIKALFFVVSDFVEIKDRKEARHFICQHIYPDKKPESLPEHWINMNYSDLFYLIEKGHSVGAHTRTHARLSGIRDRKAMETEIVSCGNILESKLGKKINHFAYPFGNLVSISPLSIEIARRRYEFVYSGMRGENNMAVPLCVLRRDCITPQDSPALLGGFLEGASDWLHKRKLAQLDTWAQMQH